MKIWSDKYGTTELIDTLEGANPCFNAVLMPDLFIDHFVSYPSSYRSFEKDSRRLLRQGGGALLNIAQTITKGGNAVNTAMALAQLGGEVIVILRTDKTGLALLRHFTAGKKINLDHVKTDGRLATSTQLEFKRKSQIVNVMIGDQGSVTDFGPEFLTKADLQAIETADCVGVFNWSENERCEDLALKAFSHAKRSGHTRTFFDSGDPSTRPEKIPSLFKNLLTRRVIDAIGLNENEFSWFLRYLREGKRGGSPFHFHHKQIPLLFEKTVARIDLHTADYAMSYEGGEVVHAPAFNVIPRRSTAAGDTWNAANIMADAIHLPPTWRILFANAAAGFYISAKDPIPPTLQDIIMMIKSRKLKKIPT